jgi:DNA recombination protein RmuC
MIVYILIAINLILTAAVIYFVLKIKASSTDEQFSKFENGIDSIGKRLTDLQSAVTSDIGKVREENKESVMRMFGDLTQRISGSLFDGRTEMKTTLEGVSKGLEEKFEKLQKSSELKLEQIRENVETKLTKSIERSSEDFQKIAETFTRVNESVNTFIEIGKDINNLNDILASPKLRGNFGEFSLQEIVSQVIPEHHYRMQHSLGKEIVDCVIKLKQGYLCVDSKFPLENYRRATDEAGTAIDKEAATKEFLNDVKKHITAIKNKYIVPEKTLDFAFMYIPAESVYYELVKDNKLMKYAFDSKVIPVSPNTFFAYLNVIAVGFKGMKIEEEAREILKALSALNSKMARVKEKFDLLGKHIDNAKNAYTDTSQKIADVENTVRAIDKGKEEDIQMVAEEK